MTTRTWIGGGNNQASNPLDWSPTGAPQQGDALQAGGAGTNITMNVRGNDLAGDELRAVTFASFTANLSHQAVMSTNIGGLLGGFKNFTANLTQQSVMTAGLLFGLGDTTFNVSQQSTLNLSDSRAAATVNLSQNSTLHVLGTDRLFGGLTVNISGNDTAVLFLGDFQNGGNVFVNLDQGARWSGTLQASGFSYTTLTVNGGAGSVFNNDGASTVSGSSTINADVIGKGSVDAVSGRLEFVQSVGSHQSITDTSLGQIDRPNEFAASITLAASAAGNSPAEIDLEGLAKANSYTFKNDMLRLFSGNKVIDALRLTDQTQYGFAVEKTASSVNIVGIDPTHPATGTLLPMHS